MKKQILLFSALIITGGILAISSCKKEDVTAPVITVTGGDETVSLQGTYTDKGATATDEEDGDVTNSIVKTGDVVDVNKTGVYTIKYNVTDAAGNAATEVTRKVTVKNDAEAKAGTYSVTEVCSGANSPNYTETITISQTVNNRIHFAKFANYTGNSGIYANVTGTTVDVPSQTTATAVGSPAAIRSFNGSGSTTSTGFTMNYTEVVGATSTSCSATYTKQ